MGIKGNRHILFTGELGANTPSLPCEDCPQRLIQHIYHYSGMGNAVSGKVIILPYKNDEMLNIILDTLGTNILEELYITAYIKCEPSFNYPIDNKTIRCCYKNLYKEFSENNFTDILLLGDAARHFFNIDNITVSLNKLIVTKRFKRYVVNYDPLVKLKDDTKFESFKEHLIKWYNAVNNKIYDYEIVKI